MDFLDINHFNHSKEVYLKFLDDLIILLQDYREKLIREDIEYDELC